MQDPHWTARSTFARKQLVGGKEIPALPSILAKGLRRDGAVNAAPRLGNRTL